MYTLLVYRPNDTWHESQFESHSFDSLFESFASEDPKSVIQSFAESLKTGHFEEVEHLPERQHYLLVDGIDIDSEETREIKKAAHLLSLTLIEKRKEDLEKARLAREALKEEEALESRKLRLLQLEAEVVALRDKIVTKS